MEGSKFLKVIVLGLFSTAAAVSYAPCSYTMDMTNTYHRITCADLTAEEVLTVFSQTPIHSNIQQLTIRNMSGSNNEIISQIINRVAPSQETLSLLALDQVNITALPAGVKLFPNLGMLSLVSNKLQSLSPGWLNFTSKLHLLRLQNNSLASIAPGTFDEADWSSTDLGLQGNQLTQFPSNVFQKVLESMVGDTGSIELGGNTITCDCSIAWLLRDNPHLLPHVYQGTCSNGLTFEEMPSGVFENCPLTE